MKSDQPSRWRRMFVVCLLVSGFLPASLAAQIPDEFKNLQHFPADITRDSLMTIMRGFSFALGVRCQYCHVGGDGISFEGVEFDSDDDVDKQKARFMLRWVDNLNRDVLPLLPNRDAPSIAMECKTCHRGQPRPVLLTHELRAALDSGGVDAAATRYRELREREGMSGAFDFGEWETNVLAENLAAEGRTAHAIGIYELNAEFYPRSVSIAFNLGQLYESEGDVANALEWYDRVLSLAPNHGPTLARVAELR